MRIPVLLLTLAVAGPALAQASGPSRSGRSASVRPPFRAHVAPEEMLPATSIYSWVDEADGRYVAAQAHTYLTPAQRTAWAAGADAEERVAHPGATEPPTLPAVRDAARLAVDDGEWLENADIICDVLKCVHADALGRWVRPTLPSPRS